MGNMAMEEYAHRYKLFLNFSSTRNSLPGYLKMGFVPLVPKTYLTRCTGLGLLKLIWREKTRSGWQGERIALGEFDDIVVSDRPRPEDMRAVISSEDPNPHKTTLWQDEEFFRWRFLNHKATYVFYYHRKNNVTTGFVAPFLKAT